MAVLASILFSVFSGAKERARRTTCQSNLKQMSLAIAQYAQENDGVYPLASRTVDRVEADWSLAIFPYIKEDKVFVCPDKSDTEAYTGSVAGAGNPDYDYNSVWLNVWLPAYSTKKVQGIRESTLATPSSIWLNEDKGWSGSDGECHYCRFTPKSSCGREGVGSTLHSGGGNYSYNV